MQNLQHLYFFDPAEIADEMRDQKLTFYQAAVGEDAGYAYDPGIAPLSCYERELEWDVGGVYTKIRDLLSPDDVYGFDAFLGPVFYFRTLVYPEKLKAETHAEVKGKTKFDTRLERNLKREFPKSYYKDVLVKEMMEMDADDEEANEIAWRGVLELYSSKQITDLLSKYERIEMKTIYDLVPHVKAPRGGWERMESKKEPKRFIEAWIQALTEADTKNQSILLTWEID
ncbi:MAG: hypothetical protein LW870_25115 [Pirellula sp.]|jgi:hypothetical protein|nr:hypothetical protein [Pirellula sp.]